jgi:hypothetical protein
MLPTAHSATPAPEAAWAALVARAARRIRSEHTRRGAFLGTLAAVPACALAAACAGLDQPLPARAALGLACALPLLGALAGRLRPLSPDRLHARIDRQFGLADEALAARELATRASPAWRAAILRQALDHAGSADWDVAWPLRWPRRSGLVLAAAALAALLAFVQLPRPAPAALTADDPRRTEQQTALADLARDWEKSADELAGEEAEALRQALAELQKQLAAPELTERELLLALARVDDRLADTRASLGDSALADQAEALAEALAGLEPLAAAAQALREREFTPAAQALDQAAATLSAAGAQLALRDATSAETERRLAQLAENAAKKGDAKLAQTAKDLREATAKKDAQALGQCTASLADQAREAASADSARSALGALSRSLSAARLALAEGRAPGSPEPQPGQLASLPAAGPSGSSAGPGPGIGSAAGDHSLGTENALDPAARQESLSGQAQAEGESTRRTIRADQAAAVLAATGSAAELAEFARLSREAVEDESLPLEHRRAIQRYFQLIRPPAAADAVSTSP